MLMNKARELRQILLDDNWSEMDLPKLEGDAGRQWFRRWRLQYGIVKKVVGMRLKVSWKKVKSRVAVLLGNIFRLRAFWELCHPDVPMRFLSIDQKPLWFNNDGLCGTFATKGCSVPGVRKSLLIPGSGIPFSRVCRHGVTKTKTCHPKLQYCSKLRHMGRLSQSFAKATVWSLG